MGIHDNSCCAAGKKSKPCIIAAPYQGALNLAQRLVVVRADRFATLLSEGLGEVVCPYRWLGTTLGANLLNRRSSTEAVLSRKRGARISEGDNRWAAGIPTSFVSLKNLSNSFQFLQDWKVLVIFVANYQAYE